MKKNLYIAGFALIIFACLLMAISTYMGKTPTIDNIGTVQNLEVASYVFFAISAGTFLGGVAQKE